MLGPHFGTNLDIKAEIIKIPRDCRSRVSWLARLQLVYTPGYRGFWPVFLVLSSHVKDFLTFTAFLVGKLRGPGCLWPFLSSGAYCKWMIISKDDALQLACDESFGED